MLDDLLAESVNYLEEEFYSKPFRFSYSSLCKLLYSPAVFYQLYVLGNKEDKTDKHLIEGRLIHCLLLDDKSFEENFVVSPVTLPSGMSKTLVDKVYFKTRYMHKADPSLKFEDFSQEILEVMRDMNYYQLIKSDKDKLSKVITKEASNYWEFLKKKEGRDLIDNETLKYCQDAVDVVKTYPRVVHLLGLDQDDFDHVEVFNEEYMEANISGCPFGFKGIIDNLKIDHDNKIIYINDFKTTSKALKDFKESVEYYNYWLQAVLYMIMVSHKYLELLEKGYELKFHFIVIDQFFNVYPFPVSEATRNLWLERFTKDVLPVAQYHFQTKRYELPYEFDKELVIL
jgi:hypothetical protein